MSFVVSIAIFFYNVHSENKLLNLNLTENFYLKLFYPNYLGQAGLLYLYYLNGSTTEVALSEASSVAHFSACKHQLVNDVAKSQNCKSGTSDNIVNCVNSCFTLSTLEI